MKHILVELMSQLTHLTEEEMLAIEESFPIRTFSKGTFLLKEGQVATDAYYVIGGCIRSYKLTDGDEVTLEFFTEDQPAADFGSLAGRTPSDQYFICMEETTVAVLNGEKELELYRRYPRFETFCRAGMEEMYGNQQKELSRYMISDPEERYLNLLKERPSLINRVPQYHIASYLGIQPETLSRIRKRIFKPE